MRLSASEWEVREIPPAMAQRLSIAHHYLHRRAPCSRAFGLFAAGRRDECRGVVMYGTPSSAPLRSGIAGPEHALNVVELTRLWVSDDVPANGESFLIGRTVARAGKEIVVSFAEIEQGHAGIVYQATNWLYTGLSAKRTNWTIEGDARHCQSIADQYTAAEIREKYGDKFTLQPRPRKHRYVYINAKRKRRAEILAALRYPVIPYPKSIVQT